jgi:transposase
MRDKHQTIEEPCEGKLSCTVLKTNGVGDNLVEFTRTNQQPRNKTERRRSHNWAFYQLRQFLEYKGIKSGIEVIAVNPRYPLKPVINAYT